MSKLSEISDELWMSIWVGLRAQQAISLHDYSETDGRAAGHLVRTAVKELELTFSRWSEMLHLSNSLWKHGREFLYQAYDAWKQWESMDSRANPPWSPARLKLEEFLTWIFALPSPPLHIAVEDWILLRV